MNELISKKWTEMKAESSWFMFKIMSEFVEGFERLPKIGPCVSIFGSARTKPHHPNYEIATKLAFILFIIINFILKLFFIFGYAIGWVWKN